MSTPTSFQIDRGLFKFDFTDHHAVLGMPIGADVKEVRKRYLKIARRLHPDSCKAASDAEKKLASQLLSKLVNPAYEQLSQNNNRDYLVSLGHMGRRLAGEGAKAPLASEAAKQLFRSGGANLDNTYRSLVQKLATTQYDSLNQVLDKIAEISELNMVYLMLSKGEILKSGERRAEPRPAPEDSKKGPGITPDGQRKDLRPTPPGVPGSPGSPLPDSGLTRAAEYIRRAEGYMSKNNFAAAVLELREAQKLDPNNSRCHSLLGAAYLKQNQPTMAKVYINKALQLNPKDELAMKGKQYLDKLAQKGGGSQQKVTPQPPAGKPQDKPTDRKFWPFGGKKK